MNPPIRFAWESRPIQSAAKLESRILKSSFMILKVLYVRADGWSGFFDSIIKEAFGVKVRYNIMSDTFNPHEILSRLRAKPSSSSNNSTSIGHGGNNSPYPITTSSSSQNGNNNTISNTLSHTSNNTSKNHPSNKATKAIAASLAITAPQPQVLSYIYML